MVHEFKDCSLKGGTLIVSIPNLGLGNTLLTDFLLERHAMDQVAAIDADVFPPVAMLHRGKARFPVRIHADEKGRVAVLRSEFPMAGPLMRPVADRIIEWAKAKGVGLIVALDSLWSGETGKRPQGAARMAFTSLQPEVFERAAALDLEPFSEGALAGVPAMLVLHSRLRGMNVLALLAVIRSPDDDLRSTVQFAETLPHLVPGLHVDRAELEKQLAAIERAVRGAQEEARALVRRMRDEGEGHGEGSAQPSMYM